MSEGHYTTPDGKDPLLHRAEMTAKFAERTFDMLRSSWVCDRCGAEVEPPSPLIVPVAPYRALAQAADVVAKATANAIAGGAGHGPCPTCHGETRLAHADLFFYASGLASDLVLRHTPGAAPQLFRWSLAGGLVPEAWTETHDAGIGRDALLRTLAGYKEQGDAAQGLATLSEAVATIPGDPLLLKFLPWVNGLGQLELSRGVAAAHVRVHPNEAEGHYWLAQATIEEIGAGRKPQSAVSEVVPALETAIRLRPDYPDALIALANVSRIRSRDDEAEKALRALLDRHPDHPEGNYTLGLVLLPKGPEEALACFERGERAAPEDADYPRSRARALLALGRNDEARAAIARAKQLAPRDGRIDQVAAQIPSAAQKSMTFVIRLVIGLILLGVLGAIAWTVYSAMQPPPKPPPRPPPARTAPAPAKRK